MTTTRREFIAVSAATATAAAAATAALSSRAGLAGVLRPQPAKPLSILILGGTGFLGPATIDAAQARGHKVTIFNRGKREKYVGSRDNIVKIYGNRDPDKHAQSKFVDCKEVEDETSPKGLKELEGKKFDAVVDNSGFVPRIVKASAELLAPNVGHYVFISTLGVYKNNDKPNMDESDELGIMADPTVEEMGADSSNYGPLKALCEQAAEKAMPGRVTNLRAGYIVGPGDTSDRFTYWPVRASQGGTMLVPGTPDDAVQFIDVRDLADFIIHCMETKAAGAMNAMGPAKPLKTGGLIAACVSAAKNSGSKDVAVPQYVPYEWLAKHDAEAGTLPILLPPDGETAGFHTRKIDRAIKAGIKFRSAEETCKALLDWWPKAMELRTKVAQQQTEEAKARGCPAPKFPPPDRLRAGLAPEREAELLKEYAAATTK